jgi:hypothetical protein
MQIVRTEPATGGEQRTPRALIEPVFSESDEVEPDVLIDASTSETWPIAPNTDTTRWTVQTDAIRQFVAAAEQLDSQAAAEQAGGSDEKGGIYAAVFNQGLVVVGEGDDDGDLNSSNIERKLGAIRVRDEHGATVPLPYGGTAIMQSSDYLDKHYMEEFGERPLGERPKRARTVFTDGELRDHDAFAQRLGEDHSDKWPAEHWFVAILGYGADHDATLAQYQGVAAKHSNVHVYSFDQVSNPAEIAEDMAVAVLGHK